MADVNIIVPNSLPINEAERTRRSAPASQKRGVLISQAYEGGPQVHVDLCQCIHCEGVFPFVRGSGVRRGWCMNCNGMTCGRACCDPCVNHRQMLENMERGMTWAQAKQHKPIVGRVEEEPPKAKPKLIIPGE
jgi:hypothetical protein